MRNISNQAIVGTVNREIRMSSQIITSIQENMDPIKNPKYDTGYIMEHAHNIGGEFVDLIRLSDSRHIFVLGDLSGKGISASMSMVIIKSIIRTFLQETRDFKLLVEKVNSFIRYNLPKGTFFEGVFALLDFNDDTMYYINCGVPALFLYTKSYNNVIEIQGEGRVLGFAKDIGKLIKVKKVKLSPGDVIVTCTDGLIDSKSLRGETYGKERIQRSITENTSYMANVMARTIYNSAADFLAKELDDDVSILVIKRLANKN
jgi:serine phosphatase RsbU (regulator of sigma subunit)